MTEKSRPSIHAKCGKWAQTERGLAICQRSKDHTTDRPCYDSSREIEFTPRER